MIPGTLKRLIRRGFNSFGLDILNLKAVENLNNLQLSNHRKIEELKIEIDRLNYTFSEFTFANQHQLEILGLANYHNSSSGSKAQLSQDLFVLDYLKRKRNGYFLEFGATDGHYLSNTFLLEKEFGWNGILAEPGRSWHVKLHENRNCIIDHRCVWSKSDEVLNFNETSEGELSTIDLFVGSDWHAGKRNEKNIYKVETISLNKLLSEHNAPFEIDYLSVDTEGSEYEILSAFDFSKYKIKIITVEHNFTRIREDLYRLLTANGFKRVFETISQFDDWYINESLF